MRCRSSALHLSVARNEAKFHPTARRRMRLCPKSPRNVSRNKMPEDSAACANSSMYGAGITQTEPARQQLGIPGISCLKQRFDKIGRVGRRQLPGTRARLPIYDRRH